MRPYCAGSPAPGLGALGGLAAEVKQVAGQQVQGQDRLVGGEGVPGRGALTRLSTPVVSLAAGGRGELGHEGGAELAEHALEEAALTIKGDHVPAAHPLGAQVGDQEEVAGDGQLLRLAGDQDQHHPPGAFSQEWA